MRKFTESFTAFPVLTAFSTGGSSSLPKVRVNPEEDLCALVGMKCGTVATGVSATVAAYTQFTVIEATAATASGSAITNATVTLGAATACQVKGAVVALLRVTSDLTTATEIQINGITYRTTSTHADGEGAAALLASAINGNATSRGLPNYRAVANHTDTGLVLVEPTNENASGLTVNATGAGSTIVPYMTLLQGAIEVAGSKLSTNRPKYIGVSMSTFAGTTSIAWAQVLRRQTYSPAFPGVVINVTT